MMTEQPVRTAHRRPTTNRRSSTRPGRWVLGPGELAAVPVTRRAMMAWLRDSGARSGDADAAELVLGEILANAVEHTDGPARVSLEWAGEHPTVRVTDTGSSTTTAGEAPCLPALPSPAPQPMPIPGDLAESGRGLALASMLALDLRLHRNPQGGVDVTATLDLGR